MKARVKATGEIITVGPQRCSRIDPDYWTRLEHQYAGQFMQAMISSSNYIDVSEEAMADASLRIAHALVEKMKEADR